MEAERNPLEENHLRAKCSGRDWGLQERELEQKNKQDHFKGTAEGDFYSISHRMSSSFTVSPLCTLIFLICK